MLDFLPTQLRESERKDEDVYEDLALFEIEEKYGGTAAGKNLGIDCTKL